MRDQLKALVDETLPDILSDLNSGPLGAAQVSYDIEIPKIKSHGDLSINLAFHLARALKKNPFAIAERCQKVLEKKAQAGKSASSFLKSITVEKPGFINFKFKEVSLAHKLLEIASLNERFGRSEAGRGEKAIVEFVSANPTGPLTIAHGRQAALGDTLARILAAAGYAVHKEFYLNDGGRQIRLLGESLWVRYRELFGQKEPLPEEGYQGAYLIDAAKKLKELRGDQLLSLERSDAIDVSTEFAIRTILEQIKKDLSDLGVSFDEYFSERSLANQKRIEEALAALQRKNVLYEAEGALWFRSTQFGDDKDRVLRKQTGEFTYLAPDIAYHESKYARGFRKLINLWGPDHHGYVARLRAACQALGHPVDELHILIVQLTTLYRAGKPVRMSTRAGEFVTLRQLMDEVGVDAARFFFLMRKVDTHLDFDLELAKQKTEDNPVYYLQYAHARISNILVYAGRKQVEKEIDLSLIKEADELDLIRNMAEFPEVLKQAAQQIEPYRVADYLRELAATFHRFYAHHRVVSDDEPLTKARLLLTDCVRIVLRNGLEILGVSAPQKM